MQPVEEQPVRENGQRMWRGARKIEINQMFTLSLAASADWTALAWRSKRREERIQLSSRYTC